jgi:hypothetical protein
MGLWLMPSTAMGRDLDGHYANSPLKPWFDQLKQEPATSRHFDRTDVGSAMSRSRLLVLSRRA